MSEEIGLLKCSRLVCVFLNQQSLSLLLSTTAVSDHVSDHVSDYNYFTLSNQRHRIHSSRIN